VGTAKSLKGNGGGLRRHHAGIRIGPPGAHKIDGVGAGFVVPLWQDGIADAIEQVSTPAAVIPPLVAFLGAVETASALIYIYI
jgi:cysteine synthase A